jgi:hypothetical protein
MNSTSRYRSVCTEFYSMEICLIKKSKHSVQALAFSFLKMLKDKMMIQ